MRSYKLKCKNFDPVMERQTNECTYERTDERKSEKYISPHTSYVGGIMNSPHYILEDSNFDFKYVRLCVLDILREKSLNYLQTVES